VPSPAVRTKGPDLRPLTVLVSLGLSVRFLWVHCLIVPVDVLGYHQDTAQLETQLDCKIIHRFPEDGVSVSHICFTDKENLELLKEGTALKRKECKYTIAAGQVWT